MSEVCVELLTDNAASVMLEVQARRLELHTILAGGVLEVVLNERLADGGLRRLATVDA